MRDDLCLRLAGCVIAWPGAALSVGQYTSHSSQARTRILSQQHDCVCNVDDPECVCVCVCVCVTGSRFTHDCLERENLSLRRTRLKCTQTRSHAQLQMHTSKTSTAIPAMPSSGICLVMALWVPATLTLVNSRIVVTSVLSVLSPFSDDRHHSTWPTCTVRQ